jgi:hypothetical protein
MVVVQEDALLTMIASSSSAMVKSDIGFFIHSPSGMNHHRQASK